MCDFCHNPAVLCVPLCKVYMTITGITHYLCVCVCVCVFSLQSGMSESSLEVSESDVSWTSEDSTTSGKKQSSPLVSQSLFIQRMVEVFNVL